MNSFFNLLLPLICIVASVSNMSAQKIEFYGFNPLWGEEAELSRSFWEFNSNTALERDTVFNNPRSIDTLFKRIEDKADVRCIIGFYFIDIDSNKVLDVFIFHPKYFFVESSCSYSINKGLTSQQKRDIISISRGEPSKFSTPSRKNLLFEYLFLYETEYYSRHPFYKFDTKPTSNKIKKYKINGRVRPKGLSIEIDKALNGKKNAVYKIIETTKGNIINQPKERRINKRYRRKFDKNPHLYYYLNAVTALYNLKRTKPNSKTRNRKVNNLNDALNTFLQLDTLKYTNREKRLWRRLGRRPYYDRNQLIEMSRATINCSDYTRLALIAEKKEKYNEAIRCYSQSIKTCGDTSNLQNIRRLLTKKKELYTKHVQEAISAAHEHKIDALKNNIQAAVDLVPYFTNPTETIPIDDSDVTLDIKVFNLEKRLNRLISSIYDGKIEKRTLKVTRHGQRIDIRLTPLENGTDLTTKISYYPPGEIMYQEEDIDNSFIVTVIQAGIIEFTNKKKPKVSLHYSGSADLTSYKGFVAKENYKHLRRKVIDCNPSKPPRELSEIRKTKASNYNKNLALAFLRAYHKKKKIEKRLSSEHVTIDNTTICGMVINQGDKSDRSITITISMQTL